MSREYSERYDEKKLNIPDELEMEWRYRHVDAILTETVNTEGSGGDNVYAVQSMAENIGGKGDGDIEGNVCNITFHIYNL